ncbi:MAG TPA: NADAR family protein [Stellaceae bacterium]|nr:NADAR family protein [Stellaceae bacterium]
MRESEFKYDELLERAYFRDDSAVFFKTRDMYGELSNMASGFPLHVNGLKVPSVEALYQACRFPHLPHVQRIIIAQSSPMTAKMKSKPFKGETRDDWEFVRVPIMKWCLRLKLAQHFDRFSYLLLATGNKSIVEQSRKDKFWGATPEDGGEVLRGCNVLGRLLMELRERVKEDPTRFGTVVPVPIESFCLFGEPIRPVQKDDAFALSHRLT